MLAVKCCWSDCPLSMLCCFTHAPSRTVWHLLVPGTYIPSMLLSCCAAFIHAGVAGAVWHADICDLCCRTAVGPDSVPLFHPANPPPLPLCLAVYMQAQLDQCGQLIQDAQWDSLRLILPRIKKNPTNAGGDMVARKAAIITMRIVVAQRQR